MSTLQQEDLIAALTDELYLNNLSAILAVMSS